MIKNSNTIDYLYGTAFFTNIPGIFLTAGHVLQHMLNDRQEDPTKLYGLNDEYENVFTIIDTYEFHPKNIDVAIGKVNFQQKPSFKLSKSKLSIAQDVTVFGYSSDASEADQCDMACWIDIRAHKGYVSRCGETKAIELLGHPNCLELNFPIERGVSGSPLLIDNNSTVVGICIRNRVIDSEFIYRYGMAYPIYSIFDDGWSRSTITNLDDLFI